MLRPNKTIAATVTFSYFFNLYTFARDFWYGVQKHIWLQINKLIRDCNFVLYSDYPTVYIRTQLFDTRVYIVFKMAMNNEYMICHCDMSVKMQNIPSTQIITNPSVTDYKKQEHKNPRTPSSSDKLPSVFAENIMFQRGHDDKHTHRKPGHHPKERQGAYNGSGIKNTNSKLNIFRQNLVQILYFPDSPSCPPKKRQTHTPPINILCQIKAFSWGR